MKKILTVVGARPQFIKAAIVSRAIACSGAMSETMVHTGQHYDDNLSRAFFEDLRIPSPAHNLGVGSGTHGLQTGKMLEKLEQVMLDVRPDTVLVYGDTNSTLAATLAAVKLPLPVGHVEAGLRSYNRRMPEEINRIVSDHLSTYLFAPTPTAVENLVAEGVPSERIYLTGDVMYDAAIHYGREADQGSSILARLCLEPKGYILATIHRAENTDDVSRLKAIAEAFVAMAQETAIVLPLHPRTRASLAKTDLLPMLEQALCITEPAGYLDMIALEKNARVIATDSGGVQKEAYFYQVPCVTLRDETEWVELVKAGWNRCVSPQLGKLAIEEALREWSGSFPRPARTESFYGSGNASQSIVQILADKGHGQ